MFKRQNANPAAIQLSIAGNLTSFSAPADFALFLEARTAVPADRMLEWLDASPEELLRARQALQSFLSGFQSHLEKQTLETGGAGSGLSELSTKLFSRDHHWREIFCALNEINVGAVEFKILAVTSYLQFVQNRLRVLDRLIGSEVIPTLHLAAPHLGTANPRAEFEPTRTEMFSQYAA